MLFRKFCEIWDTYVVEALSRNPLNKNSSGQTARFFLVESAERQVYDHYCSVKKAFKDNYYPQPDKTSKECTIDRYKRAAILSCAFNEIAPIQDHEASKGKEIVFDEFFINQSHAIYLGFCSLLLDYKAESIQRVIREENSEFFRMPKVLNPQFTLPNNKVEPNDYLSNMCRDLYFSKVYGNFNIVTMANVFFLLELDHFALKPSDLLPVDKQSPCE